MHKLIAYSFVATIFLSASALADFSGARLNYGRVDIQFSLDEESVDQAVKGLLFGDGQVVAQLARVLARQEESYLETPRDLTIEIDREGQGFKVFLTSNTLDLGAPLETSAILTATGEDLIRVICNSFKLEKCELPAGGGANAPPETAQEPAIAVENALPAAPVPELGVLITIGSLPSDAPEQQILLPVRAGQNAAQSLEKFGAAMPLDEAIRARADQFFSQMNLLEEAPANLPAAALPKREFFIVHCTAFGASDSSMREWAKRQVNGGHRNKSHGVILPSGEWLSMWPFADQRVWATKTETCRETRQTALGAAVNIEIHYFCAPGRPDAATDAQYQTLAKLYKQLVNDYGPLTIVSHREVDRGLRDGHGDPLGFSFAKFYQVLTQSGVDVSQISKISDGRSLLRVGPDISHRWKPQMTGGLVLESARPDDCKRDH